MVQVNVLQEGYNNVEVYWQENAWTDISFSLKWIEKILSKAVTDLECVVLYLVNLTAQETDVSKEKVASQNWEPTYEQVRRHCLEKNRAV